MPVNNHGTEASMPQVNIHNRPLLLAIGNLTALKTSCINLCLERKHVNDHLIPSLTGFNLIASNASFTKCNLYTSEYMRYIFNKIQKK